MKGKSFLINALVRLAKAQSDGVADRIAEKQVAYIVKMNA